MIYILDNLVAILLATLAGLLVSLLWRGRTRKDGRLGGLAIEGIAQVWLACILAGALILAPPEAGVWVMTLATPVVIWIGFLVPALVVALRGLRQPARLVALVCGQWLTLMLAQAVVLRTVGLAPPPA